MTKAKCVFRSSSRPVAPAPAETIAYLDAYTPTPIPGKLESA